MGYRHRQLVYLLGFFILFSCTSDVEQEQVGDNLQTLSDASSLSLGENNPEDYYPAYSWDYLNLFGHFYKAGSNFSEQEAEQIALRFDVVSLESAHGEKAALGSDVERSNAAMLIKKYNPDCKVIAYRSLGSDGGSVLSSGVMFTRPEYEYMMIWNEDKTESTSSFDYRLQGVRDYWKESVYGMIDIGYLDGMFLDGYCKYTNDDHSLVSSLGQEGYFEYRDALFGMLDDYNEYYNNKKLLIGNGLGCSNIDDIESEIVLDHVSGGMLDHFANYSAASASQIAQDIEHIIYTCNKKKVCLVKAWSRYDTGLGTSQLTDEEAIAAAREDIVFPLACYLMGAGEYSYFGYSWQWLMTKGAMVDFQEYNKPLGKPLGDYTADGWNYYREFEHAKAWANLETGEAEIIWDVDLEK